MQRALLTRRQRLRRLRELQNGTAGKTAAGVGTFALLLAVSLLALTAGIAFSVYSGYVEDLPADPRTAFAKETLGPAQIFDRNGTLLYEFEDENEGLRDPVPLRDISDWAIKATIATEDNDFYDNPGVNVRGLARAAVENFTDFDNVLQGSGGSSITQQLVKNVFIPQDQRYERSPERKLKEAALALELTRLYDKDQILEWYLNQIQYGNRTSGIEAAARRYFNTHAKDLTLAQAALLAGLPQQPAAYDPFRYPEAAKARQEAVLDLMVHHGHITDTEVVAAKAEPLLYQSGNVELRAPHWVFYVRDQLIARYGEDTFKSGGLRVTTTLDVALNERAEQILKDKISEYEKPPYNCDCHNGSVVAMDNKTGEILAMVGSRDYYRTEIEGENNNATAVKQPGSSFKPIVYLAAFMNGWNPATLIYDQATRFPTVNEQGQRSYFTPVGPNRVWHGPQSARTSLASSLNTAANKAAGFAGINKVIDVAHEVGITTLNDRENYGVSIATGGANITLLDQTFAYTVLSNNGEMRGTPAIGPRPGVAPDPSLRGIDPVSILNVTDVNGRVIFDIEQERAREQVVPAGYAYQVTDILKDNNAKKLTYTSPEWLFSVGDNRPVAAKTGTQQGLTNIADVLYTWQFGYIPDMTVGVWIGNQDNKPVNRNITSASTSALVWKEIMAAAIKMYEIPPKEFPVPSDIEWQTVNNKREPIVKGQKLICAEDLRMWATDGNPSASTRGGALIGPDCRGGTGSPCSQVREVDSQGREVLRTECPTPTAGSSPLISQPLVPQLTQPSASQSQTQPAPIPRQAAPLEPAPAIPAARGPAATAPPVFVPPPVATAEPEPQSQPQPQVQPQPTVQPQPQSTAPPAPVPPPVQAAPQPTPAPIFFPPTVVPAGQ